MGEQRDTAVRLKLGLVNSVWYSLLFGKKLLRHGHQIGHDPEPVSCTSYPCISQRFFLVLSSHHLLSLPSSCFLGGFSLQTILYAFFLSLSHHGLPEYYCHINTILVPSVMPSRVLSSLCFHSHAVVVMSCLQSSKQLPWHQHFHPLWLGDGSLRVTICGRLVWHCVLGLCLSNEVGLYEKNSYLVK